MKLAAMRLEIGFATLALLLTGTIVGAGQRTSGAAVDSKVSAGTTDGAGMKGASVTSAHHHAPHHAARATGEQPGSANGTYRLDSRTTLEVKMGNETPSR